MNYFYFYRQENFSKNGEIMKKGIINRFEGKLAVVEFDDEIKEIPKS
jgi:hypothetical protein